MDLFLYRRLELLKAFVCPATVEVVYCQVLTMIPLDRRNTGCRTHVTQSFLLLQCDSFS